MEVYNKMKNGKSLFDANTNNLGISRDFDNFVFGPSYNADKYSETIFSPEECELSAPSYSLIGNQLFRIFKERQFNYEAL